VKILWVKAVGLVPLDTGGKIRSFNILKELSHKHSITLFTFYPCETEDAHLQLSRMFDQVIGVPLHTPRPGSFADVAGYARSVVSRLPYSIAKYQHPKINLRLRQLLETESYDVIVCDFVFAAPAIPWSIACPKVFFAHNVEAMIWHRHFQVARNPVWKIVCWREYNAMHRAEYEFVQKADHVITLSQHDRDVFAKWLAPSCVSVIRTGVDLNYFEPSIGTEHSKDIVFTGSMDWRANQDGVLYFVQEILPRIQRAVADVRFWIVGRHPSAEINALTSVPGVQVTGTVADIRPYLRRAAVYVVPLRVGSGTRLKIFEAMAMSKVVISTSVGAEGLPVRSGENLYLADEPEEFARRVVEVLGNAGVRSKIGRAARNLVEQNYSWAAVATDFECVLAKLVSGATTFCW